MKKKKLTKEEKDVLKNVVKLQKSIDMIYKNYDFITDEYLIDSYIHELKSLNTKYSYYIRLCKEKQLNAFDMTVL